MRISDFLKKYSAEIFVSAIGIIFGTFLMFSSFSGNDGNLLISTKAWSDFASHIPLIRSFSLGSNFPPEYPLFPGEAIKYHFIFYAFVGLLEKLGLPISLALNIPSIIGFVLLIIMIYLFAKTIFKSNTVGILSIFFFLFNSSLSFIYYIKKSPLTLESIINIPKIDNFQSFAPYDNGIVAAFWNLNVFTNQRHLAISFALSLIIILFLIRPIFTVHKNKIKNAAILGIILGLSFYLHLAVLLMTSIIILGLGILFSKIRINAIIILAIAAIIAIPQYLYLNSSEGFKMLVLPGFLIANELTFFKFVEFWIYNLGLSIILIPLGFLFANRKQKRILLAFIPIFIIGNLVQFSPEIAANHKFFNYFLLIGNMFSAYSLFIMWKRKNLLKPLVIILTFFMIFGGIIDFLPLVNDHKIAIADYENNENANWILNNSSKDSVFANTTYLFSAPSLAGRKILLGWPYFAWSQGYNTEKRGELLKDILGAPNNEYACNLLKANKIDFVEIKINETPDPDIPEISSVWQNEFTRQYYNPEENYSIYKTSINCL